MTRHTFHVRPAAGHIGAEIVGLDLSKPLSTQQWEALRQAFHDHQVLFFHDQHLTRDQHIALGRRFGKLHIHPMTPGPEGYPEIFPIHADAGSSDDVRKIRQGLSRAINGNHWHSDVSCDEEPPLGSLLYLREVPPVGGDTLFASGYAAFEALSPAMQRFLSGLRARHSGEENYKLRYAGRKAQDRSAFGFQNGKEYPEAIHPVVRTHPDTGRQALFVNPGFTAEIVDLAPEESRALLDFLYRHQTSPEFTFRLRWRPNTLALWDNRCVLHRAIYDYAGQTRSGERVTIQGDQPYFIQPAQSQWISEAIVAG
ncbi:MAG: taurine dioxygenase [Salinicola sp.]|uniref:TauD/TfdA dioxygenase family protein n=1 Tax=uncultured Salinicola sp. TaxID=1193542 RepID=UPI000C8DAB8D|nr:TauD/TfdA family dioxygenase [uncultured Salinicola sp.]MAM58454.1 taurine dioxygenase [Salinicola sp.]